MILKNPDVVRATLDGKAVNRLQHRKDPGPGPVSCFLDLLKPKAKILEPPEGSRIWGIEITVEQDQEWQSAINSAGPDTFQKSLIYELGEENPPKGKGTVKERIVLINFPHHDGGWYKAIIWAESKNLEPTSARDVFAIGNQYRKLHVRLRQDPMYVTATTAFYFRASYWACYFWWKGLKRGAEISWTEGHDRPNIWLAFRAPHHMPRAMLDRFMSRHHTYYREFPGRECRY